MDREPIMVSACLLGLKTRYNGKDALSKEALTMLEGHTIIPVCPEQLAGLPTPRPRAEIVSGDGAHVLDGRARVINENGLDVTETFIRGAKELLKVAEITGAKKAFLKEGSPSCGVKRITKAGATIEGAGVLTSLLKRKGIGTKGFG
ncbi:MAG: DUF523 domain-containing protein [Deltaproteobacteria bacterium]|nr:DUF523 domain-containing protein [Deltaproteobacteria bacterium]